MAQLINEAKRFQKLAGLITESQLNEGIKTIDANSRDFKVEGNEYLKLTDLKPGVIIAKNKSYSDKAELEGEAGEFEKVENDYIHWKTKNGGKKSWNASYIDDLVLVKNLEIAESQLNEAETIKVGAIYVYEHPKAGPVKVKALGASSYGDDHFTVEALEDKGEVKKGNQYNAEIKNLTASQQESLNIAAVVNEALAKARRSRK